VAEGVGAIARDPGALEGPGHRRAEPGGRDTGEDGRLALDRTASSQGVLGSGFFPVFWTLLALGVASIALGAVGNTVRIRRARARLEEHEAAAAVEAAPRRRPFATQSAVVVATVVLAVGLGALAWGISNSGRSAAPAAAAPSGGVAAGKEVFASAACGGCHTLRAAGSSGTVGPNLDQARPSQALVVDRVTHGKGAMPSFAGQLTPQQIQQVATFVSSSASP
jgi:mono/diheme cytochrome c family protein